MAKPFLTAEWRKLVLLNYEVDPSILKEYVPFGTELDIWEGKCYMSLVGFMFLNTKVKGMKLPMHVNFEEVNLRFYVKHKTADGEVKRGVTFLKEIVPKPIITFVANKVYKEHYQTCAMSHLWDVKDNEMDIGYKWYIDNRENLIVINSAKTPLEIKANSEEDFITEHYWGYTKVNDGKTSEYEVKHPSWKVYQINNAKIDVDFGLTYGEEFKFLNSKQPDSVMLAEGSEISVGNKRIIT